MKLCAGLWFCSRKLQSHRSAHIYEGKLMLKNWQHSFQQATLVLYSSPFTVFVPTCTPSLNSIQPYYTLLYGYVLKYYNVQSVANDLWVFSIQNAVAVGRAFGFWKVPNICHGRWLIFSISFWHWLFLYAQITVFVSALQNVVFPANTPSIRSSFRDF